MLNKSSIRGGAQYRISNAMDALFRRDNYGFGGGNTVRYGADCDGKHAAGIERGTPAGGH